MLKNRYLRDFIAEDLATKMVLVGGPKQVGKTTLAKALGDGPLAPPDYLNWDRKKDRDRMLGENFLGDARLLIFDELHKYRFWKTYLKGLYDTLAPRPAMLVTGSARMDLYRQGGDSLQGRYHYYRLHPFSVAEISGRRYSGTPGQPLAIPADLPEQSQAFAALLKNGGFPEPLFSESVRDRGRWYNERLERLVKEDIRDTALVRDLSGIQLLSDILPRAVGSLFSINSLREDLQVTHKTIAHWTDVLERFYFHFRLPPFQSTRIKALRKEPKLYLWDWSGVEKEDPRFENLVAQHLLKFVHFLVDTAGHRADLSFLRTVDGKEVDFLVTLNNKPWFAVETKLTDQAVSPALRFFRERFKIPFSFQLVATPGIFFTAPDGIQIISADRFLAALV